MIDKYLECGEMFVLHNDGVKAECVITKESEGIYELKNIAVMPNCQRKGYGKRMIDFLLSHYTDCKTLLVGTGDVPSALRFYHKCGFIESHRIKNFFTDNYDHPMFEDGKSAPPSMQELNQRKAPVPAAKTSYRHSGSPAPDK